MTVNQIQALIFQLIVLINGPDSKELSPQHIQSIKEEIARWEFLLLVIDAFTYIQKCDVKDKTQISIAKGKFLLIKHGLTYDIAKQLKNIIIT